MNVVFVGLFVVGMWLVVAGFLVGGWDWLVPIVVVVGIGLLYLDAVREAEKENAHR